MRRTQPGEHQRICNMRHFWTDDDLLEHFTISAEELGLLANKPSPGKLGFAVLLKFYQYEGRFPANRIEVPKTVTLYIARQLGLSPSEFYEYDWHGRTSKRYRVQIREFLGFRKWSRRYSNTRLKKRRESSFGFAARCVA